MKVSERSKSYHHGKCFGTIVPNGPPGALRLSHDHAMDGIQICRHRDRNRPSTGFVTFNTEMASFKTDNPTFNCCI